MIGLVESNKKERLGDFVSPHDDLTAIYMYGHIIISVYGYDSLNIL